MATIKEQFPNLNELLNEMSNAVNGSINQDTNYCLSYKWPVLTFGHHVGDNYLNVYKSVDGVIIILNSKVGSDDKLRTYSAEFKSDFTLEEWNKFVDELLLKHAANPEYAKFAGGKVAQKMENELTGGKRGCMLTLVVLVVALLFCSFLMVNS